MEIVYLKIENFRGIKHFESYFNNKLICFVGRGDSGKSTILDAISYVLCGAMNIDIRESDFYKCDTSSKIYIELSLKNFPKEFIAESKWGFYIKGFKNNQIIDDVTTLQDEDKKIITIKFEVDKSFEAKWSLKGRANLEDKQLSWADREKIKAFKVSDYNDRHFSWVKGSPLYKCLKQNDVGIIKEDLLNASAKIKETIKNLSLTNITQVKEKICHEATKLGLSLKEINTSIDLNNLFIKEGYFCFHDTNNIPMKQQGKGTKRLLSIAIQSSLLQEGAIALIDEIEQGLEPDRIKNLIRELKINNKGQLFITTHSPSVVEELPCSDILLTQKGDNELKIMEFTLQKQKVVRKFPEAWYAKKIILCEGKTEVGFCRAINNFMQNSIEDNFSSHDTIFVNCGGEDNIFTDAKDLLDSKLKLGVLCDNDIKEEKKDKRKAEREKLIKQGVKIFTYEENYCFEKQIIYDSDKEIVNKIFNYVVFLEEKRLKKKITWNDVKKGQNIDMDFSKEEAKKALINYMITSNIKNIEYGEGIGKIVCDNIKVSNGTKIKENIDQIVEWVRE